MNHVYWLYPNQLAGRPGPVVEPWSPRELRQGGFDLILSVASDLFPHSEVLVPGLARKCIPFPDVVPPDELTLEISRAHLRLAFDLIQDQIDHGNRVLVHCMAGKDRTGLVLAHYLAKREGLDAAEAIRRLKKIRPQALSAEGWEGMALELVGGD